MTVATKCLTCPRYLGHYPELLAVLDINEEWGIGRKLCIECEDLEQGVELEEL